MASSFDQVVEVLEAIKRNDATPRYEYGEPRPDSEKPPGGTRWSCPRELADDALGLLKLVEERPRQKDSINPSFGHQPEGELVHLVSRAVAEPDGRIDDNGGGVFEIRLGGKHAAFVRIEDIDHPQDREAK